MKKILLLTILLTFNANILLAFNEVPFGARPEGMAHAYVAVSDDVHSIFYNPAGLGTVENKELAASYGSLYQNLDADVLSQGYVAYAHPVYFLGGTASAGWSVFSSDILRDNTFYLSFGRELKNSFFPIPLKNVFFGFNLKLLNRQLKRNTFIDNDPIFQNTSLTRTRFSWDAGFLHKPSPNLSIGISLTDINRPDISFSKREKLWRTFRIGASYNLLPVLKIVFMIKNRGPYTDIHSGIEANLFDDKISFRGGFERGDNNFRNITGGAGFKFDRGFLKGQIDYSFLWSLDGASEFTAGTHKISTIFRF